MADILGKMAVDLAQREAGIEKGLTAWARFHLTLDRAIQTEADAETRETYHARQAFEFGKVLAFQTAYPLTRSQFQRALRLAGAEADAEARFEEQYAALKFQAIKTRTLETAYAYKHALRRSEQRLQAFKRRYPDFLLSPATFFPVEVIEQAKLWLTRRPIPARYLGLL